MWKQIYGYEKYSVSEMGQVKNDKTGRILKQKTNRYGYRCINLCKNGKSNSFYIHRLVALSFIPNSENKLTVNHIDGDKVNK